METADIVQRAIDYMEEHIEEPFTLEQVASAAAMSVPNLYRVFYALTGHPIKEYIRKRRISMAASLLRQTDIPSIDIGFRCGFDAYQTFIKTFKRTVGMTPGLYRKAELIFSFERICLFENVAYMEEREMSERYPDVKVVRLAPLEGIGFMHSGDREEGLEEAALLRFRVLIESSRSDDPGQIRLFGWNVDLAGSPEPYGYQLAAVGGNDWLTDDRNLRPVDISGGLYATTRTQAGSRSSIIAAWNRLLAEWLPRSTFELGDHGFVEEYQLSAGHVPRFLKLYLPVKRRLETETIRIAERQPASVLSFQAVGIDCAEKADEAAVAWIARNGFTGDRRLQVYMSCSYGIPPDESHQYEIHLVPPDEYAHKPEDIHRVAKLDGGLYACMVTLAYGTMTGVLERIYRWLSASSDYEPDGDRAWYAVYLPAEDGGIADFARSVRVECCVPVISKRVQEVQE